MANLAWMVKPKPHGIERIEEFLQDRPGREGNGIVAIGWPGIGDLSSIKTREDAKQQLQTHIDYKDYSNGSLGWAGGTIYRFICEMQIGDYVLTPYGQDVYVGRIVSGYHYDKNLDNNSEGYCHQRSVEWLFDKRTISRSVLTGRVFNELKGRQTLSKVTYEDVHEIVTKKKYLFTRARTPALEKEYLEKLQNETLYGINSSVFEDAVRIVMQNYFPGLTRQATTGSPQGDTDLLVELPGGLKVRIQVKYYQGDLGADAVEQLADSMDPQDVGYVVTSGEIGQAADQEAKNQFNQHQKFVRFINGREFVDLLFENIDTIADEDLVKLGLRKQANFL